MSLEGRRKGSGCAYVVGAGRGLFRCGKGWRARPVQRLRQLLLREAVPTRAHIHHLCQVLLRHDVLQDQELRTHNGGA